MGKSLDEQETTIGWMRDDAYASIYTSDTTMMTRFDKFVKDGDWDLVDTQVDANGWVISKRYKAPKQLLFGRGKQMKLTEEQKEARRINLASNRADNYQ